MEPQDQVSVHTNLPKAGLCYHKGFWSVFYLKGESLCRRELELDIQDMTMKNEDLGRWKMDYKLFLLVLNFAISFDAKFYDVTICTQGSGLADVFHSGADSSWKWPTYRARKFLGYDIFN